MRSWFLILNYLWTKSFGVFIELKPLILSPFVSNHAFKFQRNRPIREYFMIFFLGDATKGQQITSNFGHRVTRLQMSNMFFSQNSSELQSILSKTKNIILKAYSTQKVGSGGNFESGKHVSDRRFDHTSWSTNMKAQQLRRQPLFDMNILHNWPKNHPDVFTWL